jgi:putative sigma-54 modulation protein
MRLDITGRHVEVTTGLRQLVGRRLARMERVLNDAALSAQVILTKEKYRHQTEIVIHTRGDHILRGNGEGTGWPLSVRLAAGKIEQQAQTLKGKWNGRKRKSAGTRIARATRYAVKPMSVDDAALRVDGGPETFVVFRNAETDAVSILYRRKDGNLGLIEPE